MDNIGLRYAFDLYKMKRDSKYKKVGVQTDIKQFSLFSGPHTTPRLTVNYPQYVEDGCFAISAPWETLGPLAASAQTENTNQLCPARSCCVSLNCRYNKSNGIRPFNKIK